MSDIEITGNNGWKTPAGLAVGMQIDDALKMYGDADYTKTRGSKTLCAYYDKLPIDDTRSALVILYSNSDKKITKLQLITAVTADFRDFFPRFADNTLK